MQTTKIFIFALFVNLLVSCNHFYSLQSNQINNEIIRTERLDFTSTAKIPRTQLGFELGYGATILSDGDIWACGGWNTRGNYLYKWSSTEGVWNKIKLPVAGGMNIDASIYFNDSGSGWVFKDRNIFHTLDGGQTWRSVTLPDTSEITRLEAIKFINSSTGYLGGTTGYINRETFESKHGIEILHSSDGGNEFHVCYKSNKHQSVQAIHCLKDRKTIVALIDGTFLLINKNGGKDWIEKTLPSSINAASIDNEDVIWIVGREGKVYYSSDLGNSWIQVNINSPNPNHINWKSIVFTEKGTGVVVGDGGLFAVSTEDRVWQIIKSDQIIEDLFSIQISGSNVLIQGKDNIYCIGIQD